MDFLTELWMPIVVSAVFVFIASSVLHMAIPIHRNDYEKVPDEAGVMESLRGHGLKPGNYMFPCPGSMKEMGSPETVAKYEAGPVGFMMVLPNGPPRMGPALAQWFVYCLVVSVFVAYVASFSLAPGLEYMGVFRLTGTVAFLGYGLGAVTDSIWKGVKWSTSFKFVFDGLVYGLVTAGSFAWLWPDGV